MGNPSRRCKPDWVTPAPPRPSTPTPIFGPIPRTEPAKPSTRCSVPRSGRGLGRDQSDKSLVSALMTVSRPVGGVLFAPGGEVTIHLSGLPGDCPARGGRATHVPHSALLRVGFTEPAGSPRPLVRSCRTVSPLPVRACARHRRSALCCTFLRVAPTGR